MTYILAIDDGHGMETAGKRTPVLADGTVMRENEFNRAAAEYLGREAARCGVGVVYTAAGDADVSLKDRVEKANDFLATVFVSFHANAFDGAFNDRDPEGLSVYTTGSAEGTELAKCVSAELAQGTPQQNRGVKVAQFYVLKYTDMPAILIEAAFMDNRREADLLRSDAFRKECAVETMKGICRYLGIAYVPEPVAPAPAPAGSEFLVRVTCDGLNIRKGPGMEYKIVGVIRDKGAYTIVDTNGTWGRLKSGAGWISISPKYVTRI